VTAAAAKLPPVDAVIVGVGLAGTLLAKELTDAGLRVVGLERGADRDTADFAMPDTHDELRYARRGALAQDLSRETITFRNRATERALPMRRLGSFLPGEGVGGAALHWNGLAWRFGPWDFETRSRTVARYGKAAFADDCTSQDWGVSYHDLEPHYDRFECVYGIGGKAGNLAGRRQPGGNPFEGPRSREYPNPPMKTTFTGALFAEAAKGLGYSPFPAPSANMTRLYTNPYGLTLLPCVYCGFCERFGCEMGAKASPQTTVLPVLRRTKGFELRVRSTVRRVNLDASRKRAVSVTYVDAEGRELEQPADLVLLASYVFNNVRLLLLSGIGEPYDPAAGRGIVGRNYAYQTTSDVQVFFEDKELNRFMGAGALATVIDDFNGDNFDHAGLGFVGGGMLEATSFGARPIAATPVPEGTPRWGSDWKKAVARYYNRSFAISCDGGCQSYRANCLDLDPAYRDVHGDPLVRMTFDFRENEYRMSDYLTDRALEIARRLAPSRVDALRRRGPYEIVSYQTTHNTGGAVMGADPAVSVVNRFLQSWDVPNLFVVGASAFPQNAGYNPSGTVAALTYWCADAIKSRYLKQPGPLA
jgi:gluconate 2-dehydrogenase alpha chain